MSTQQLQTMFRLQNQINSQVNPNWIGAGQDWTLAAGQESAEAIDHHGWKWWKDLSNSTNWDQLRMEQVDVWHFMLSAFIEMAEENNLNPMSLFLAETRDTDIIFDSEVFVIAAMTLLQKLRLQAALAYANRFEPSLFASIGQDIELSPDLLYRMYIAKYCLNSFRQNNGYKEGTYIKVWADGREDNEHLQDIIDSLVQNGLVFDEQVIYDLLQAAYCDSNSVELDRRAKLTAKSDAIREYAKEHNLPLVDVAISSIDPISIHNGWSSDCSTSSDSGSSGGCE